MLERHALLQDSDEEASNNIDGGNQNRGQRIALTEARRAVHRAAELCFARHRLAPLTRLIGVDQSGVRSESIAICLPGIASSVKRAVTSAVRTAPWLTTRY